MNTTPTLVCKSRAEKMRIADWLVASCVGFTFDDKTVYLGHNPKTFGGTPLAVYQQAPELLRILVQAVESSGYSLSGPTDSRAAEHGEPAWVCHARLVIAAATR